MGCEPKAYRLPFEGGESLPLFGLLSLKGQPWVFIVHWGAGDLTQAGKQDFIGSS